VPFEARPQRRVVGPDCGGPSQNDIVPRWESLVEAEGFARDSLQTITIHGPFGDAARNGQAEAGDAMATVARKHGEELIARPSRWPNSDGLWRRCAGLNPDGPEATVKPNARSLRSETSAALRAAARKDLAAGGSGHASTETMGTLAVQVAGLKSSFHEYLPPQGKKSLRKQKDVGRWEPRTLSGPGGAVKTHLSKD